MPGNSAMEATKNQLTILFVDVADSTRLYESLGDVAAFREVRACLSVFEEVSASRNGRVVKTIGDGSMCAFSDANVAVRAACEMQQRLHQRKSLKDRKIEIRIGLHQGTVLLEGNDVYGDTVNTASRMAQFATGGQIITTGETVALLLPLYRNATRRLDTLTVKGKHHEVTVHEVLWEAIRQHPQLTARGDTIIDQAGVARLRLKHAGHDIIVVTSITLGRHAANGIVLKNPLASRHHAYIERRKDEFVLTDQSSHGTFVAIKGGEVFKLHRQERVLHGSGVMSFGHRARNQDAEAVGFWCEPAANMTATVPPDPAAV